MNALAYSINGDPTRGYKNISFRGLMNYTGQAYLRPNPSLKDGGDTYVCYITDRGMEVHIVTSPSKIGGLESRGAFNVGIAVLKGFEIKTNDGKSISISKVVRELRAKFAEIAMTPTHDDKYLFDNRSLDRNTLNKSLSEWLDQTYKLVPVERKEIVMRGKPEMEFRAYIGVSSVNQVDDFFNDPHYSKLEEFGSVEVVVCSNLPNSLDVEIPREKKYDLILEYRRNSLEPQKLRYSAFFKSDGEKLTLPVGTDINIMSYEKFDLPIDVTTSLEELKSRSFYKHHVGVDNKNEVVTIPIEIKPREIEIEVGLNAKDADGKYLKLNQDEIQFIFDRISFISGYSKKKMKYDEKRKKYVMSLSGEEIIRSWKPSLIENDEWTIQPGLYSYGPFDPKISNSKICLTFCKLSKERTLKLEFRKDKLTLSASDKNGLLKNLALELKDKLKTNVEKPVIDPQYGTITFTDNNKDFTWILSSALGNIKAEKEVSPRDIKSGKPIELSVVNEPVSKDVNDKPVYTVTIKVKSKYKLDDNSYAELKISRSGKFEKIPLSGTNLGGKVYMYTGSRTLDPEFKNADNIYIDYKRVPDKCFKSDGKYPNETINVTLGGNYLVSLKNGITLFIAILIFLLGALMQRYFNVPFNSSEIKELNQQIDSLKNIKQKLDSINSDLKQQSSYMEEIVHSVVDDKKEEISNISASDEALNYKKGQIKKEVAKTSDEIKNDILAELSKIESNQKGDSIASQAREIVSKKIDSLNENHKKWFKKNIIENNDAAVAGIVNKIIKNNWDPFTSKGK